MKKINILLMVALNFISVIIYSQPQRLFVQNNYGSIIAVTVNGNEIKIALNNRVLIGDIPTMELVTPNSVMSLEIRTTGMGSGYGFSPKTSLQEFLNAISQQADKNKNKDCVITVHPSGTLSSWNIIFAWESKSGSVGFSMKTPEERFLSLTTADQRLTGLIKDKLLGQSYAEKAYLVCSANYQEAVKLGKINLCENLKRNLVKPEYHVTSGKQPLVGPTIQEIKDTIDLLYRTLQKYVQQGWAK